VGDQIAHDAKLASFLETFSPDTRVIRSTSAQFVMELAKRWQAAHPDEAQAELLKELVSAFDQRQAKEAAFRQAETLAALTLARVPPPPYSGPDDYIFISYKREDSARLSDILHRIVDWGQNIWYDKGIPGGAEWTATIESHIKDCQIFIFFISEAAIASDYVRSEVEYAISLNKPLVAVRLEEAELKYGLAMLLGRRQTVNAATGDWLEELQRAITFHQKEAARRQIAP